MGGGLEAHNCTGVERKRRLVALENIESARHAPQHPQLAICKLRCHFKDICKRDKTCPRYRKHYLERQAAR